MLVVVAYGYLASAFIGMAWTRLRRRAPDAPAVPEPTPMRGGADSAPITLE